MRKTHIKEMQPKETQIKETRIKETQIKKMQPKETQIKKIPIKETQIKKIPIKETQIKEMQPKETQIKETRIKEMPRKETQMKNVQEKEKKRKPLGRKKKRLIMIIAAGTLLVSAAGYTVFIAPLLEKDQWIYKEEMVERGTLKVGVSESGALEYGITSVVYDLDLDVSGDEEDEEDDVAQKYLKIQEAYVKTGQRISEGELLYKFTEDSISDVRMLLKSAAAQAWSEYAEAQAEYNLSVLEAGTDYEVRKLDQQYAASIYEKSSQAIDNEISMLQVEINRRTANTALLQEKADEAAADYSEAQQSFSEAEKPSAEENNTENFMALQKEYLNLQTRYENAKSALNRAQQELEDNAREIEALQKELLAALAQSKISKLNADEDYQKNIINGENARISYEAKLESLRETLQEAEEEKDKIQQQLDAFEAFVGEDGCIYADGGGIVTDVAYASGDRLQETGPMLSYAMPDDMTISVDVTQEDIVDLEVGDPVDITFAAYGDVSYQGSIRSINTTATSRESNTVSYTVVVAVEGDTALLYGGMTADIIFVTEQKEDVLYISKKAIIEENGRFYVYYKTPTGEMERKEVEIGIDNGVNIEILSGLEEGDTIYLASRVSSENAVMSNESNTNSNASGNNPGNNSGNNPENNSENSPENMEFNLPEGGFDNMEGMPGGAFEGGTMPGGMPGGGQMMPGGQMPEGEGMPPGGKGR